MSEWQPIETAPKDGAYIIGWWNDAMGKHMLALRWTEGQWREHEMYFGRQLTLWAPIDKSKLEPIETAPKSTTKEIDILAFDGVDFCVVGRDGPDDPWFDWDYGKFFPESWMPLPAPPVVTAA